MARLRRVCRLVWRRLCIAGERYAMLSRTGTRVALWSWVAVSCWLVLARVDALLKSMHPPGGGHYGIGNLAPVVGGSASAQTVTQTWDLWFQQARASVRAGPEEMVIWYLAVDFGFAIAYTALLAGILGWIRSRTAAGEVTYRRLFSIALALTPPLLVTDWVENLCQGFLFKTNGAGWLEGLTRAATGLKLALLVLVAIPLLTGLIRVAWASKQGQTLLNVTVHPTWLRALAVSRVQVALAITFGLLLFGPGPLEDQSLDVNRRLGDNLWLLPVPVAIVIAAGLVLGGSSFILLDLHSERVSRAREARAARLTRYSDQRRRLKLVFAVSTGLVISLLVLAGSHAWHAPIGLYVMLTICGLVGLLSLPMHDADVLEEPAESLSASRVPSVLAAAPIGIFGASLLFATFGDAVYLHARRSIALAAIGALFLLGSLAIVRWFPLAVGVLKRRPLRFGLAGVAAALAATLTGMALASPWLAAKVTNGTIGIMGGFVAVTAVVGTGLVLIAELVPPPGVFRILRFRQLPVLTLVLVWFLATSFVDKDGTHQIRQARTKQSDSPTLVSVDAAFQRWVKQAPVIGDGDSAIRPLVFVASEGGGIRAAYWTAQVLDCLIYGSDPCNNVSGRKIRAHSIFAASGISGGALGLAEVSAEQSRRQLETSDWIKQRLNDDYVAPTFARMLFGDLPNAFIRLRSVSDRAAVLEGSWERSWPEKTRGPLSKGFFATSKQRFPLLMLSGTSVTDGCRFEVSALRTALPPALYRQEDGTITQLGEACRSVELFDRGPSPNPYTRPQNRSDWVLAATKDAADGYLCSDIHVSTAALLAARFPYVTPSGRVQCEDHASFVVDGGYFDNSGLSPILELWTALQPLVADKNRVSKQPCIVPLLIHIDNHYADAAAPAPNTRPQELLVPLQSLLSTRDGHDQDARVEAMLSFSKRVAPNLGVIETERNGRVGRADRIANLYPRAHPGTEPPLGWTMSNISRNDLVHQLSDAAVRNELAKARRWFAPGVLKCRPRPAAPQP
jgi:hypothetical protein